MKSSWDKLATSAPIDRKAALATSKGEGWSPTIIGHEHHVRSDVPLPTRPVPKDAPNLAGLRVGSLIVIGLGLPTGSSGSGGARWVVRCDCGAYEHRKAKALRAASTLRCSHCDRWEQIKSGYADPPAVALAHRDAKRAARALRFANITIDGKSIAGEQASRDNLALAHAIAANPASQIPRLTSSLNVDDEPIQNTS